MPSKGDAAEDALSAFEQRVAQMHAQRMQQLSDALTQQQWYVAADTVRKLKFLAKLRQEVERLEDNLLG